MIMMKLAHMNAFITYLGFDFRKYLINTPFYSVRNTLSKYQDSSTSCVSVSQSRLVIDIIILKKK